MSKRALRRHHRVRIRAKARFILSVVYGYGLEGWWNEDKEWVEKCVWKATNTFTYCSCYRCGNPRRFKGTCHNPLTRQERKANLHAEEEIQALRDLPDSSGS
jgi:hypothetical protein